MLSGCSSDDDGSPRLGVCIAQVAVAASAVAAAAVVVALAAAAAAEVCVLSP
jgi:hypothetical protein